jgi:hypothetical protein
MKPAQPPPPPTIHAQLAWGTGPHDGNTREAPRVSSIHAQLAGCPGLSISKLESLLTTEASGTQFTCFTSTKVQILTQKLP